MHIFDIEFLNKQQAKNYLKKSLTTPVPPEYETEVLQYTFHSIQSYTTNVLAKCGIIL
jgi:hypothetical protein